MVASLLLFLARSHPEPTAPAAVAQRAHAARVEEQIPPDVRAARPCRPTEATVAHAVQHCGIVVPPARSGKKDGVAGVVQAAMEVPTVIPRLLYIELR